MARPARLPRVATPASATSPLVAGHDPQALRAAAVDALPGHRGDRAGDRDVLRGDAGADADDFRRSGGDAPPLERADRDGGVLAEQPADKFPDLFRPVLARVE